MSEFIISGAMLRDMVLTAAALLEQNKAAVDALNVFPVPDGDTGTNMSMTMQSAAKHVRDTESDSASDVAAALAQGALRGARGNSGVILSQIFRGFSRAVKGENAINAKLFAAMFASGADEAYKAVTRPKEGTILTVVRSISEALKKAERSRASLPQMIDIMMTSGEESLAKTPELLPVLKEAGVVDSGGVGLMTVLRGFRMAINGENIEETVMEAQAVPVTVPETETMEMGEIPPTESIKFHYCTEFFVINLYRKPTESEMDKFRTKLNQIGDSVVVAFDDGFIKCHVHTCVPGKALQYALLYGELDKVKIENMLEQNREMLKKRKDSEKEFAIIAVSAGEGIDAIFRDLGAAAVISGGQTMNPSIDSIVTMIKKVNARNVFILPNNSNIIMAAQQAANITEHCAVHVVPTKTIMQGISAIMAFNTDRDAETNAKRMTNAAESIMSGSVTYAVRSTSYEGKQIDSGDILGMINNKIAVVGKDKLETSANLLREMLKDADEYATVTLLYGEGMTEEEANGLVRELEDEYPDADFIVQEGGQPLYYFYMSVE